MVYDNYDFAKTLVFIIWGGLVIGGRDYGELT